jgi:hypothetical protein
MVVRATNEKVKGEGSERDMGHSRKLKHDHDHITINKDVWRGRQGKMKCRAFKMYQG